VELGEGVARSMGFVKKEGVREHEKKLTQILVRKTQMELESPKHLMTIPQFVAYYFLGEHQHYTIALRNLCVLLKQIDINPITMTWS